jgi:DNA-binding beta-propeller fold protein YncE
MVSTVFGNGYPITTDSPGLIGSVNNPSGAVYDKTENYVYVSDFNGGGLIRKLAVSPSNWQSPFTLQYDVKTVFFGVNCNFCQFFAVSTSRDLLYTTSRDAHNIKALDFNKELMQQYHGSIIAGSLGDTTCSSTSSPFCYGNADGMGTFARYNTIGGITLQVDGVTGDDLFLFITDTINNKIRQINMDPSMNYMTTTFDSGVDLKAKALRGIVVNNNNGNLYVTVSQGIYVYSISQGATSKTVLAGLKYGIGE